MPWNEPEDKEKNKNKQDPNSPLPGEHQGPPHLDEALKRLFLRLGLSAQGQRNGAGSAPKMSQPGYMGFGLALIVAFLLWFVSGFYVVGPAEEGTILRFGRYITTVGPGPHWFARFIDNVVIVNVKQIQMISYTAEMLTKKTNLLEVQLNVHYRINDADDFIFNVVRPLDTLEQATGSAVRQVIGQHDMDEVLSTGRSRIRDEIQQTLIDTMAGYKTGIVITDVTLQLTKPPQEVTAAFDDALKAQEDQKRYISEADAYSAGILPLAQGQARKMIELAKADSDKLALEAQADVAAFLALLPAHKIDAQVLEQRLYLDTIQSILAKSTTVLSDGHNMIYLPLNPENNKTLPLTDQLPTLAGSQSAMVDPTTNASNTKNMTNANNVKQNTPKTAANGAVTQGRQTTRESRL